MGGSKKQTIGYKYFIGMHMVLCHGPIDCISRIQVDKRTAWQGLSGPGQITVNSPTLFGGESREGGVSGVLDIDMGGPTQGQNSYLLSRLGALLPAFRGVVGAVLNRFYVGNNPYLKAWSFLGTRVYKTKDGAIQWYPQKAGITRDPNVPLVYAPTGGGSTDPGSHIDEIPFTFSDRNIWVTLDLAALGVTEDAIVNGYMLLYTNWTYEYAILDAIGLITDWEFYTGPVAPENLLVTGTRDNPNPFDLPYYQHQCYEEIPAGVRFVRVRARVWDDFLPGSHVGGTFLAPDHPIRPQGSRIYYGVAGEFVAQNIDMNPAHIIRECLTNPEWGMGYNEADIDDTAFAAAADTYWNEAMGLSLLWDRQIVIEDFIKEVARHVDSAVYVSRQTGQFVLKPIRFDYDPDTLLVLNPSNITKISNPNKPTFGELSNAVTVKFWNHLTSDDDSVSISDPAMEIMQGGPIGTTIQYPGFTTHRNATLAAQRDLKALSSSALSCTVTATKVARGLNIGDTFKLTWPRWKVENLIMRVNNIAYGDGKNNQVRINATQDIYSTPQTPVISDGGSEWVDPSLPATPVIDQIAIEVPYLELVQQFGQTATDDALTSNPDLAYVLAASARSGSAVNARLWTDAGAGYEDSASLDFSPIAKLDADILPAQTDITFVDGIDLDVVVIGTFFQMGEEICRIDSLNEGAGQMTIGRGCLDTTPRPHLAGATLFFWDQYSGTDQTEYLNGETLGIKITPVSGQGPLPLAEAIPMSVDLVARAYRPYPPGQFQINGAYYPTEALDSPFTASWVGRDRTQQTSGEIYDHTFAAIGPEAGTTYRVRLYVDGVLDDTVEPATSGLTLTPSTEGLVRVEVHSIRDTLYSFQPAVHEFYYGPSSFRAIESGEFRVTQDGDVRVTED